MISTMIAARMPMPSPNLDPVARGGLTDLLDLERVLGGLVDVAGQDRREEHGLAVLRRDRTERSHLGVRRGVVGQGERGRHGLDHVRPEPLKIRQQRVHALCEGRILDRPGPLARDHEGLGDDVLLQLALFEELLGALGLGRVGEIEVRGERRSEQRGR
jgi:hypothetical protein